MREPRRTLTPLPPRAAQEQSDAPTWSLATSEDLPSLTPGRSWSSLATSNFRILHLRARIARILAKQAEQQRAEILTVWIGPDAASTLWRPRCHIALYPSRRELEAMTGGDAKVGSAAARSAKLTPGRMLDRRIHLSADDPQLLSATLPHEIAHIVTRDALPGQKVPLWANEGIAVLCEALHHQQSYVARVARALARGKAFRMETLFAMREYPEEGHLKKLFYAQSHSIVAFLVAHRGERAFVGFLAEAKRAGYVQALLTMYGFQSILELTSAWQRVITP